MLGNSADAFAAATADATIAEAVVKLEAAAAKAAAELPSKLFSTFQTSLVGVGV